MENIAYDEQKFKELVLYIADKREFDPNFGAVTLNKTLYLVDFLAFAILGKSITGAEYMKLELGPAPRFFLPVRKRMEKDGDLVVRVKERFGKDQTRVVPRRRPDLSRFSAEEIALVDQVIETFSDLTGKEFSNLTHGMLGWQIADYKETIPYESYFLSNEPPTEREIARARELAFKYEW